MAGLQTEELEQEKGSADILKKVSHSISTSSQETDASDSSARSASESHVHRNAELRPHCLQRTGYMGTSRAVRSVVCFVNASPEAVADCVVLFAA